MPKEFTLFGDDEPEKFRAAILPRRPRHSNRGGKTMINQWLE